MRTLITLLFLGATLAAPNSTTAKAPIPPLPKELKPELLEGVWLLMWGETPWVAWFDHEGRYNCVSLCNYRAATINGSLATVTPGSYEINRDGSLSIQEGATPYIWRIEYCPKTWSSRRHSAGQAHYVNPNGVPGGTVKIALTYLGPLGTPLEAALPGLTHKPTTAIPMVMPGP